MNNPETHLFVIWQNGRYKEPEILADMSSHFTLLKKYGITWSPQYVSSDFTRFYGVNLPSNSGKEIECGTGEFLLCVVRDENPVYEERMTSRGPETVNINLFDAKQRYRSWTGGGHKIHGTNNETETNHDLTLLIGKNIRDFLTEYPTPQPEIEHIKKDVEGANGWDSLSHLYYVLNSTIPYVVLRNYESLPEKYDPSIHGDIDLLVANIKNARYITNATAVYPEPYRVYHHIKIAGRDIPFDFRFVGDNYYDPRWENVILRERVLSDGNFYVMDAVNQYYSLLYHAYIQKYHIASDYPEKLKAFANAIGEEYVNENPEHSIAQLDAFMKQNGYEYFKCEDQSVGYNEEHLALSKHYLRYGGICIRTVGLTVPDMLTNEPLTWVSKIFKKNNSYVKAGTPWLIDNEVRFLRLLGDGVKFPKVIDSGGDDIEHWVEITAMPGTELFSNKWKIRLWQVRDYAMQILDLLTELYKKDVIHRDIRHSNILVDNKGKVSLIDFAFAVNFIEDKDFVCPMNMGMSLAPSNMYSDFYNLAMIFEQRWKKMTFVMRFASELKKIDWEHYKDKEFVLNQIQKAKNALQQRYTIADIKEYAYGHYKIEKYLSNPSLVLKMIVHVLRKPFSLTKKVAKKVVRKIKKHL